MDYKISLQPEKQLKYKPIYLFSEKKLEVLKSYIEKNLQKRFIKLLVLLIKYPILFISKKNGGLRLYVDYRQLNVIIIKNRYLLPIIKKLQIRIKGAKIFSKINIRDTYHKVQIKKSEK